MTKLLQEVYHSLCQGKELVMATIISDSGSTPRSSGARMIVYSSGGIVGTIGGGKAEGDAIEAALSLFQTKRAVVGYFNINSDVDKLDVICGGCMKVLLEYIGVTEENIELYRGINEEIQMSQPFFLVGSVEDRGEYCQVERAVVNSRRKWLGSLEPQPEMQWIFDNSDLNCNTASLHQLEEKTFLVERVAPMDTVYLAGGGHVSKELAVLTKMAGFRTIVFDDRVEFATSGRFPGVDEIHVCPEFAGLFEKFTIDASSYIVILSRSHSLDKKVLAQALSTEAGYIGMMGSSRKRATIYQALINEGFRQSDLEQVFCPVGLSIDAETPAEIGVSVVAQLIQHRAGRETDD